MPIVNSCLLAGAVVSGLFKDYAAAQKAMTGLRPRAFNPNPKNHEVYTQLYPLYRKLHDAFGTTEWQGNLHDVMKGLLDIRSRARN